MGAKGRKCCTACCKVQAVSEFYRHRHTADGLRFKCKTCTRLDSRRHRYSNRARYRAYDRERAKLPERREATYVAKLASAKKYPQRKSAYNAIARAIRDGRLVAMKCACGNINTQAHHHDYSKPLDVEWLCSDCHNAVHYPPP